MGIGLGHLVQVYGVLAIYEIFQILIKDVPLLLSPCIFMHVLSFGIIYQFEIIDLAGSPQREKEDKE